MSFICSLMIILEASPFLATFFFCYTEKQTTPRELVILIIFNRVRYYFFFVLDSFLSIRM